MKTNRAVETAFAFVLAALAALPAPALAGRPLSTEDASMLGAKACQVEAWVDRYRDATQSWLVPACNFAGIEWQLGGARTREAGRNAFSDAYFQAKTVFRSMDDSPWGVGLVAGVTRKPLAESRRGWSNPYLLVPVSVSMGEGKPLIHFNVGACHDRGERRTVTLWGAALEVPVAPRATLVAEAFGENAATPFIRAGLRFSAIADRLDLDLTAVTKPGGGREERYISLGFTLVSP